MIRLKMKATSSSPDKKPGIIPKTLSIFSVFSSFRLSFLERNEALTKLFKTKLKTISKKTAAAKNPNALENP